MVDVMFLAWLFSGVCVWLAGALRNLWRCLSFRGNHLSESRDGLDRKQLDDDDGGDLRTRWSRGPTPPLTVETTSHTFHVDLETLADCSDYFKALSRSGMRETSEHLVRLEHVSSPAFHSFLRFSYLHFFSVPEEQLGEHLQMSSYLQASSFTQHLLTRLSAALTEHNCLDYLHLAQNLGHHSMRDTVLTYLSRHLLELPHLSQKLEPSLRRALPGLRSRGRRLLCCLRKENLTSYQDPETEAARRLFRLDEEGASGSWSPLTDLPFRADKWCFTTAVLYNYLFVMGGYRERLGKGYHFKMASFRYNPCTNQWRSTAPLLKHRRHFSTGVCEGRIFAVGGWYLDSLVTPDSSTSIFSAVERYDPWTDAWTLVSSLPLTRFSLSLAHDTPLTTSLGRCLYVLGSAQRSGEKMLLRYHATQDRWSEPLPALSRAAADMPVLTYLGAGEGQLMVVGGNNAHTLLTSFHVETQTWSPVRTMRRCGLMGQGCALEEAVYMPEAGHGCVVRLHPPSLSLTRLPPLPVSACYESVFHLCF